MKKNLFWVLSVGACFLFFIFVSSFSLRAMMKVADSESDEEFESFVVVRSLDCIPDDLKKYPILEFDKALIYECTTATPEALQVVLDREVWEQTRAENLTERLKRSTGFLLPFAISKAVISGTLCPSNLEEKDMIKWEILQDMASEALKDLESRKSKGESLDQETSDLLEKAEETLTNLRKEHYVPVVLGVRMAELFLKDNELWRYLVKRTVTPEERELFGDL